VKVAGCTTAVEVAKASAGVPVGGGRPANALVVSGDGIPGTTTEESAGGGPAGGKPAGEPAGGAPYGGGAPPADGTSGRGRAAAFCL
jgi:hypothetical protein